MAHEIPQDLAQVLQNDYMPDIDNARVQATSFKIPCILYVEYAGAHYQIIVSHTEGVRVRSVTSAEYTQFTPPDRE